MSEKLTDLQLMILRALREYRKKDTNIIFSMDDFYESLPVEVSRDRFWEDIDILESDGYIVKEAQTFGEIGGLWYYAKRPEIFKRYRQIGQKVLLVRQINK